jgi:hypothetical protein
MYAAPSRVLCGLTRVLGCVKHGVIRQMREQPFAAMVKGADGFVVGNSRSRSSRARSARVGVSMPEAWAGLVKKS